MYQITINDPTIYKAGERFAKENHSTLEELVNRYVANLAEKILSRKNEPVSVTDEFQDAMNFMDKFVVNDLSSAVPIEENGKGGVASVKYGL